MKQNDITVFPDTYTEIGANPDAEPPVLKAFDGYLFDSNTSKWIPYSDTCLCNMGNDGAYAIYRFDAPVTADYKMSLRLASHVYDASYKLYSSDDNTNFSPLSVNLKITNTFETSDNLSRDFAFMDFSCGKLKLREGSNYIKVERTSPDSPNLALIRFAKIEDKNDKAMPLTMRNYVLMIVGAVVIVLGFVLMAGGTVATPEEFSYDIFSWRRITLAPILVVAGFAFEIYAILKRF